MKIFSSSQQNALNSQGFFKTPFFGKEEIKELEKLFYSYFQEEDIAFFFDSLTGSRNADIRREIHHHILDICNPHLEKIIANFFPVIAMFYTKKSGNNSELGMHIDPSMTLADFHHLGIWIPLSGADEVTGKICFLSGTQKTIPPYHALSINNPFKIVSEELKPSMECVEVNPGEAVVFDNNLLHYTQRNLSGKLRIAIIVKIIDANAPLVSPFYNKNLKVPAIEFYQHQPDYYLSDSFQQLAIPANSIKLDFTIPEPMAFEKQDINKFRKT
ncbi:MAG: phytanoyl-CoA dioxygenase family protein [Bacteroidota bacterium]